MSGPPRTTWLTGFALLALLCPALRLNACDICARMPEVPLLFDHPAAIALGQATWLASQRRLIELNPLIHLTPGGMPASRGTRLEDLTGRQLMHVWYQSTAGRLPRDLRLTLAVLFVETGEVCEIDIRMGHAIPHDPEAGPVDFRLATTKAGWHALPRLGLRQSEMLHLVELDGESNGSRRHAELSRLFPDRAIAAAPVRASPPRRPAVGNQRVAATATVLQTPSTSPSTAGNPPREKNRRVLLRVSGWIVTHRRAHGRR